MAGIEKFKIVPRKGEYVVYDKNLGGIVSHILFPIPTQISKGILVTPTVDGNMIGDQMSMMSKKRMILQPHPMEFKKY